MIIQIQIACQTIGGNGLGFTLERAGTHSIQTSFDMQLNLAGVKDYIIMLHMLWKSLLFLNYVRPQVQELSKDLTTQMISVATLYFNVSKTRKDIVNTEPLKNEKKSQDTSACIHHFFGPNIRRCNTLNSFSY